MPSGDIRWLSLGNDEDFLQFAKIDAQCNFGVLKEAIAFFFDFADFADHQTLWVPTAQPGRHHFIPQLNILCPLCIL